MAKCPVCNSRKGKRTCLIADGLICSLCCGTTRREELCLKCRFFQRPIRKYSETPAYTVSDMSGNPERESCGNFIEGALCAYDTNNNNSLKDNDAIRIVELLIDKYHFLDHEMNEQSPLILNGAYFVDKSINEDLSDVSKEIIVKVLGVIRFVAKRRTKTGREYMSVIHQYVGQRFAPGARILVQ
jgi:hypothetical protein